VVRRGEVFAEPVVAILTSTGLKDMPASPVVASATARPVLDDVIATLRRN
jgi:hypothetical protein